MGVMTPNSPDAADIFIVSSPVANTMKRNIIPNIPSAIQPILVIFSKFI